MKPRHRVLLGLAALGLCALLVLSLGRKGEPAAPRNPVTGATRAGASSQPAAARPAAPAAAERSTLADALNSPQGDIQADLRIVSDVVQAFRSNFPRDGNPVGSNAEITTALTGRNPLQLALIPHDHPAINRAGELCDRWGTPFFFHAESATRMTVRSAGPDRKMWTEDDVEFSP
jgi:hypothetical protein